MPWYAAIFLLICLSSIAVPGFNGFIGEFLILMGSWPFSRTLTVIASLGVILASAYILWMVQRVLYGEASNPRNQALPDLSLREAAILVPLAALALFMGIASPYFTKSIEPSVALLVSEVRSQRRPGPPPRPATAVAPTATSSAASPAPGPPRAAARSTERTSSSTPKGGGV
jgi:NADH-quinone oxidoreductase subunit M